MLIIDHGYQAFAFGIDSFIYGRTTLVPWNIIRYNVLSAHNPNLYGTSPWYYYIFNNILNFNIILPLAFLSLPLLAITARFEPKKLGIIKTGQTPSSILLALRLMPFYIWFGLLSTQAHKEERFMFPAFPLLCWNAAVSLGLMRGWMQRVYVQLTKAPFNVSVYYISCQKKGPSLACSNVTCCFYRPPEVQSLVV